MYLEYFGKKNSCLPIINFLGNKFELIEWCFQNQQKDIEQLIDLNLLKDKIFIVENKRNFFCDYAFPCTSCFAEDGHIYISEGYLQYLWELSYGIIIIWHELIHIPTVNGIIPDRNYLNTNTDSGRLLYIADIHLKRAIGFLHHGNYPGSYHLSEWQKYIFKTNLLSNNFTTSNNSENTFEKKYVKWSNEIFGFALCYTLFHEIAHCKFNHLETRKILRMKKNKGEITQEEFNAKLRELEEQADDYARSAYYLGKTDLSVHQVLGTIIASSISFFFNNTTGRPDHPNAAHRLKKTIEQYAKKNSNSELYSIGTIIIAYWDKTFNLDFFDEISNQMTHEETFNEYLKSYAGCPTE